MAVGFIYDIIIIEARPDSDYGYIARLGNLIQNFDNSSTTIPWHKHRLPEMWGLTEEEAYSKLEVAIKEWIVAQK